MHHLKRSFKIEIFGIRRELYPPLLRVCIDRKKKIINVGFQKLNRNQFKVKLLHPHYLNKEHKTYEFFVQKY